ncbi:hypothetical protein SPRG_01354 [Saprolegnia parasitica CBS 223.65]|uniref:PX domain-containing protein n=1 Tax=Saprolegnia parasitica (strain CBS 223.65) TaxID=695850 RepID=A0A067CXU5_SAPPC|nr:hypothetical protein SPRG_01354 [Saprolegnia parasitica CBS 223.65]KDO34080.1 hypothetical protein SPRG_01354 [Saprolegnia parasitica CBS 223.65]|eukprot:XP_012194964.1 hypothetical protein SPRG_01354 [Saprolegnia parasitica CBS 223.65]
MMTGIATTESAPDSILCKSCKRLVHLDDLGDHDCSGPLLSRADTGFKLHEVLPPVPPIAVSRPSMTSAAKSPRSSVTEWASLIQARLVKVLVTAEGYAAYVIVTTLWPNGPEFSVERRYREFHALAETLYAMHPSSALQQRLPPKLYCQQTRSLSDGFLLRRKVGLEGFIVAAIDMLLNPSSAGPAAKRTLTQLHVLNTFLGLPAAKDVHAAMHELKVLSSGPGWTLLHAASPLESLFEKTIDGFMSLKRTTTLSFPARAVFDVLTAHPGSALAATANPFLVHGAILRRESNHVWVEHRLYRTFWGCPYEELFSLKSWRLETDGTIVIVTVPAPVSDMPATSRHRRVDCILQGYVIRPTEKNACHVTMVLQMDYRRFFGSFVRPARTLLLRHAAELSAVEAHLQRSFDAAHYEALGPLVSADGLKALELHLADTQGDAAVDPKVYVVCQQIEPMFCLLVHKNSNRNALVLKLNVDLRAHDDALRLHPKEPLLAEWIMFEKKNNPRKELSAIERNTTYEFSTRAIGQGVFLVAFSMLRGKEFQLRVGKDAGYNLYSTVKGVPNVLVKRLFLTFAPSLVGLGTLESVQIVGDMASELVVLK